MPEFWVIVSVAMVFVSARFLSRFRAMRATRGAQEASEKRDATDINVNSRSPQGVCKRLAATLEANAIVVERARDEIVVVAGAPWKIEVEPLDKIALDWSFTTGLPPKSGGGNPFCWAASRFVISDLQMEGVDASASASNTPSITPATYIQHCPSFGPAQIS